MNQTQTLPLRGSWSSIMNEDELHEERGLFHQLSHPVSSTLHITQHIRGAKEWTSQRIQARCRLLYTGEMWVSVCTKEDDVSGKSPAGKGNGVCRGTAAQRPSLMGWDEKEVTWTVANQEKGGQQAGGEVGFRLKRIIWDLLGNL